MGRLIGRAQLPTSEPDERVDRRLDLVPLAMGTEAYRGVIALK